MPLLTFNPVSIFFISTPGPSIKEPLHGLHFGKTLEGRKRLGTISLNFPPRRDLSKVIFEHLRGINYEFSPLEMWASVKYFSCGWIWIFVEKQFWVDGISVSFQLYFLQIHNQCWYENKMLCFECIYICQTSLTFISFNFVLIPNYYKL